MVYRILSSKRPWALAIDGPKNRGGRLHTDKPYVCITHIYVNHRIIKEGAGAYMEMGAYSKEYGTDTSPISDMYNDPGRSRMTYLPPCIAPGVPSSPLYGWSKATHGILSIRSTPVL